MQTNSSNKDEVKLKKANCQIILGGQNPDNLCPADKLLKQDKFQQKNTNSHILGG
jgi:hypothetical protein